jgi:hypothetical protein
MNHKFYIILLSFIPFIFIGCEKRWDDYYNSYPDTVDKEMLGEMKNDSRISKFIELLEASPLDSIFQSDISYTLFIPTNEVLNTYLEQNSISNNYLGYHIVSHFIQSGNIQGKRVVQSISEKYLQFERLGETVWIEGVKISFESPLYLDGKYFILDEPIEPKPNLYEYFKISNPVLSDYIDTRDSIVLDRELSTPIGFDENGNTVYDTVANIVNVFELKYFPVKQEFRELSGTIVFPKTEDYNEALNVVADNLGNTVNDYRDIPIKWQYEVLMPHLFRQGIFLNRIEPEEFVWKSETDTAKLLNILGDSVVINYTPIEKTVLSNGYAYNYLNFTIPDSLYFGKARMEAERLLKETGINRFAWNDSVKVQSDISVQPQRIFLTSASRDSVLRVNFPKGYSGKYSVEFKGPNLFPRRYVMVVETHMDYGGIYDIYINNELVKTFDYYDFVRNRGLMLSVTGARYFPRGRYNKFDMYVDNVTSYDAVNIRFEYKGPGLVPNNGLLLDYIEFQPVDN